MDKTEVFDSNGNPYATTATKYDVRGQVVSVRQFAGAMASFNSCPTGTCQETKLEYDGHGRLARRWLPIFKSRDGETPNPTPYEQYAYYGDDTVQMATDPRGVVATYAYNNRGLVKDVSWQAPAGS